MIGDLWRLIKIGFKKRFTIYYSVDLSLIFFGAFPFLVLKLIAFAAFIIAGTFFVSIFASQFISQVKQLWAHRKRTRMPVTKEIAALSNLTGAKLKDLGFVKEETAYVFGKSLVLGIDLVKKLSVVERQAVVAHELGHIRERHGLWKIGSIFPIIGFGLYSFSKFSSPIFFNEPTTQAICTIMLNIGMLALVMFATIPVNWYLELRADRFAARFAGKENIKSALSKLGTARSRQEASETHPSISERLKALDKLKLNK
jgi:Zn-dependent protease with chaperone function